MDSKYSVVEYIPDSTGGSCGYCKASDTNFHLGMWAHTMTVEDYQDLIDRGWRRSGQYCYKPSLKITCCPMYTIKCDAVNLKLSKSQKKLLKRFSKYLNEGRIGHSHEGKDDDSDSSCDAEPQGSNIFDKRMNKIIEEKSGETAPTLKDFDGENEDCLNNKENPESRLIKTEEIEKKQDINNIGEKSNPTAVESPEKRSLKNPRPGIGRDTSKPQCKKAKLLRLEKKQKKLEEKGLSLESVLKKETSKEKTIEDFINESQNENSVNKLQLRLVRSWPRSKEFQETFDDEHKLYQKYQVAIHNDPITKCTEMQFTRFLVASPLKILLVSAKSSQETLLESWKLYVKYQTTIHNEKKDECDFGNFHSFLVASPLQGKKTSKGPSCGYGSFHQQYWLNGNLIAVGVIDILPKCVSSVYFFYDPQYSYLSLGTYGSLRELEFVRALQKENPEISNYYMGYYIHTCPKMRYKARYNPSYLLCPEVYSWHPVADCLPKLEKDKYSRFNDDVSAECDDSHININKVLVLWKQIAMPYSSYKNRAVDVGPSEDLEVKQYAELVGRKCAERILLYRS